MSAWPTKPLAVLGAGSWGTALSIYLARRKQPVRLWTHKLESLLALKQQRINQAYLPEYPFPDTLQVADNLEEAVNGADILIAVPSVGFRDLLLKLKNLLKTPSQILWVTKGLDPQSGELLHAAITQTLGNTHAYAILSGPSFAREVAMGLPTAVVVASADQTFSEELSLRFNSNSFRIYLSGDVVGVEIGGIVKNVLAIATGMSDGMQLGANARSALMTRGLAEMSRIGLKLGGKPETFTGLAGVGDLILTCTDDQSRNRRFGLALGKGKTIEVAEREIKQVIEGKRNAELVVQLAKKYEVDVPITEMVHHIITGKFTPQEAMEQLMSRAPRQES